MGGEVEVVVGLAELHDDHDDALRAGAADKLGEIVAGVALLVAYAATERAKLNVKKAIAARATATVRLIVKDMRSLLNGRVAAFSDAN